MQLTGCVRLGASGSTAASHVCLEQMPKRAGGAEGDRVQERAGGAGETSGDRVLKRAGGAGENSGDRVLKRAGGAGENSGDRVLKRAGATAVLRQRGHVWCS
jgi:hypothetical protein